ncbi:Purine nucleotide synthesis repressor [Acholeplasma oculi]|uniref:Periplasmic binding protein/LacI transcriptional regulator n=1 Tax=Acholeplasma oculi TaxID=35623 RepID=A0A061AH17_9MOLU|nr:LacI family DNA-binding transcriptional regulator [Acholeplasma oculi]CDR30227.1 Periplasmic binding protein/LacI transcriptional regulator [Acholeplasma oculi]SKC43738.1 transcriptional regulator, LacI family [Acholeplasma oculi]SUT88616.1 Purine nucleotide synthesis repressor [Acholeplasma oculi]
MINIKEIAKICNVSPSTVSRVIRKKGYVSEKNRTLIEETIKQHGYVADESARILRYENSNTIGIIISDINNFFYSLILEKLVKDFREQNYKVIITYSFENLDIERENFLSLMSYRTKAIIFIPTSDQNRDIVDIALKRNILVLQLFRKPYDDIGSLTVDDAHGAFLATNHLINQGCHNIFLLSVNVRHTPHRSIGYIKAHEEHKIRYNEQNIYRFSPNDSIKDVIKEEIIKKKPDGIIAGTNTFGLNTISAISELDDSYKHIKIISFDDIDWFKLLKISTVAQPIDEIYHAIYDYIAKRLDHHQLPKEHIKIIPELIIR